LQLLLLLLMPTGIVILHRGLQGQIAAQNGNGLSAIRTWQPLSLATKKKIFYDFSNVLLNRYRTGL
jgi:hypothetical protein